MEQKEYCRIWRRKNKKKVKLYQKNSIAAKIANNKFDKKYKQRYQAALTILKQLHYGEYRNLLGNVHYRIILILKNKYQAEFLNILKYLAKNVKQTNNLH